MDESIKHIIEGRKTFFIVPDVSLLPETYLEDYMARGYETYIIGDDRYCPLETKIDIIIKTFTDSIIFFYIDTLVDGIDWHIYIRELQERYREKVLLGVLYAKRPSDDQKKRLEKYYLFDVGIQCGCISLEYQKAKNFALIDKVMFANQACGRRKNVRAICDNNSKVNFETKKGLFKGTVLDVSMSHFSCVFENPPDIPLYEKIRHMMVNINGLHFSTDAILLMNREINGQNMYIFVFANSLGQQGLEADVRPRLLQKIYQMVSEKAKKLMWTKFDEARKQLNNPVNGRAFAPSEDGGIQNYYY